MCEGMVGRLPVRFHAQRIDTKYTLSCATHAASSPPHQRPTLASARSCFITYNVHCHRQAGLVLTTPLITCVSLFTSTSAAYVLRNLGVTSLVLVGMVTNQCVESTARDAADLG